MTTVTVDLNASACNGCGLLLSEIDVDDTECPNCGASID